MQPDLRHVRARRNPRPLRPALIGRTSCDVPRLRRRSFAAVLLAREAGLGTSTPRGADGFVPLLGGGRSSQIGGRRHPRPDLESPPTVHRVALRVMCRRSCSLLDSTRRAGDTSRGDPRCQRHLATPSERRQASPPICAEAPSCAARPYPAASRQRGARSGVIKLTEQGEVISEITLPGLASRTRSRQAAWSRRPSCTSAPRHRLVGRALVGHHETIFCRSSVLMRTVDDPTCRVLSCLHAGGTPRRPAFRVAPFRRRTPGRWKAFRAFSVGLRWTHPDNRPWLVWAGTGLAAAREAGLPALREMHAEWRFFGNFSPKSP